MLLLLVLLTCSSGRTVVDTTGFHPSLKDTPDSISITLLGPGLTEELAATDFEDKVLEDVVKKMFIEADLDGDSLLDKRELALWMHKNDKINKASEIKEEFIEFDKDKDELLTFKEFCINGGLDSKSKRVLEAKFLTLNGELDIGKLFEKNPLSVESDVSVFTSANIISNFYQLFTLTDADKDGSLSWEEFFVFSYPEDNEGIDTISTGRTHRQYDATKDFQYDFDEFDKWYLSHIMIPELLPKIHRTPRGMFDSCDTDRSGTLSYAEIDQCTKGHIDHFEPEDIMEEGDLNHDGKLSVEEVVQEFHNLTEDDDYMLFYHDEL